MPAARDQADSPTFEVSLQQERGYEFRIRFDWPEVPDILADESKPLGTQRGPNPSRLLAAAIANCLAASLVFCLRDKFKQPLGPVSAVAKGRLERNERGRYRVAAIEVTLSLSEELDALAHLDRCVAQFEDFCIITESVRNGLPIAVQVVDAAGRTVHEHR